MAFPLSSTLAYELVIALLLLCCAPSSAFVAAPKPLNAKHARGELALRQISSVVCAKDGADPAMTKMSYAPSSVQEVWNNHFGAFGSQDTSGAIGTEIEIALQRPAHMHAAEKVDKIILDYNEDSVITSYDLTANDQQVYEGVEGVRKFFTELFETLSDTSDLSAPAIDVSEDSNTIFLVWRCPASGIADATDTFMLGKRKKIVRQNVVVRTT